MRVLFLDDDDGRHAIATRELVGHEVTHVHTAAEAIAALGEDFDVAMLDHDLGGTDYAPSDENSGYEVAKAIEEGRARQPKRVIVHSFNTAGARNMVVALHGAGAAVAWAPFGPGAFQIAVRA